jgi:hypothetical protein
MAIATITASQWLQPPRLVHTGVNVIFGSLNSISRTISDILLLAKLPNKVRVTDIWVKGTTSAAAGLVYKLGMKGGGTETTFGTGTLSATATVLFNPKTGVGSVVSISDTDVNAGADVYMTASSGSWTESFSIDYMIQYVANGQS